MLIAKYIHIMIYSHVRFAYLPNFTINSQYHIGFNNPRPVPALRVDTHTPWLRSHADVVADKAHNVGVVYFSHKAGNDWEGVSAATFFVLSHNGKRVGVTALHAVQSSSIDMATLQAYVTPGPYATLDTFTRFCNGNLSNEYKRVGIRNDLLTIRQHYLQRIMTLVSSVPQNDLTALVAEISSMETAPATATPTTAAPVTTAPATTTPATTAPATTAPVTTTPATTAPATTTPATTAPATTATTAPATTAPATTAPATTAPMTTTSATAAPVTTASATVLMTPPATATATASVLSDITILRDLIHENLDPKYYNQPSTSVDILFLDIPNNVLDLYDPRFDLKVASSTPGKLHGHKQIK
eukprot:Phypoly_transcript_05515.p1 GENE.Phypoly_transcript_05515~~Phypoly_transcript_05515.p1  ORF type:complete len:358 (+),score=45.42 Phypoly_transcript_05515:256-1329(+)